MNYFSKIVAAYNKTSLILRILIGIVIGALFGILIPSQLWLGVLGDLFVGALKAVAPVLVFALVATSLAKGGTKLDRRFRTVLFLYIISTLLASFVAVAASFLFPQTITLARKTVANSAPTGIGEVLKNLLINAVSNPIDSLVRANYIGILVWASLFGLAIKSFVSENTKQCMTDVAEAISKIVRWIINLAPFGIFSLVFIPCVFVFHV